MRTNYTAVFLAMALIVLFGVGSAFLIASQNSVTGYATTHYTEQTTSFDSSSSQSVGVLVKVDEQHLDAVAQSMESKGAKVNKHRTGKVIAANIPQNEIDSIKQEQGVEAVLPNRVIKAFSTAGTESINAQKFWNAGITGKGITIAVIDSGINNHNTVIAAQDFTGTGTTDQSGHGTTIADIITNVAPDAKLISAKVLDANNLGSEASVVAGINYAVEEKADIISLSLGGYFDDINSPLVSAVEDAISQGITVVVAAGNCGACEQCDGFIGVATPGNAPHAITVGAEENNNALCISSSQDYGSYKKPELFAPGNAFGLSGTSIATPFVAGAAALVLDQKKSSPSHVKALLTAHTQNTNGINIIDLSDLVDTTPEEQSQDTQENNQHNQQQQTPPSQPGRTIHAFAGPTTKTGDWSVFKPIPSSQITTYMNQLIGGALPHADFLSNTVGMIYHSNTVTQFDGTTYGAKSFEPNYGTAGSNAVQDIKVISPTDGYIVGFDVIGRFNGTGWINETLPTHAFVHDSFFGVLSGYALKTVDFNGALGFAAGTNASNKGIILKKSGSIWTEETANVTSIKRLRFINATTAFALANNNTNPQGQQIYRLSNNTWTLNYNDPTATGTLRALDIVSPQLAFAVGDNGKIMKWNGTSWNIMTSPTTQTLHDVDMYNATFGYAVGSNGTVLKYDGTNWNVNAQNDQFISLYICVLNESLPPSSYCNGMKGRAETITSAIFTDVQIFSPSDGQIVGVGTTESNTKEPINLKLQPSAPNLNVSMLDVEENGTTSVNLQDYSDGTSFNVNSGNCAVVGSILTVTPVAGFKGIMTCTITATRDGLQTQQVVAIEVHAAGPSSDLAITSSDIAVVDTSNPEKINVTVKNIGRSTANSVSVSLTEIAGNIVQMQSTIIPQIVNGSMQTVQFTMNIQRGNTLAVVVDASNTIVEFSEANNRAEMHYKSLDAYLNITEPRFGGIIREYLYKTLKNYNIISDPNTAQAIINVGYNYGNSQKGCSLGTVYSQGMQSSQVYSGLIYIESSNGKLVTTVCGARIEGLVDALKRLNKDDVSTQHEVYFGSDDIGAIATLDFFAKKTLNDDVVRQSLNGQYEASSDVVQAPDGTFLRLKHYKPITSQSFLDYLFHINNAQPWLEPVVMAGGLWSDITSWDETGREIASGVEDNTFTSDSINYPARDVWLIELTGGPGTDCDTCTDYTYEDVVDKYWPASIGGVIKLTGKYPIAYVGHSNGGRVALDALRNWSTSGKTNAGSLSNGVSFNLPSNPIDNYIGVGVPGAFATSTLFTNTVDGGIGISAISNLRALGKTHVKVSEVGAQMQTMSGLLYSALTVFENTRISSKLLERYFNYVESGVDTQPGIGVNVAKVDIIYGDVIVDSKSDVVVPSSDANAIYSNIVSGDKKLEKVNVIHTTQTTNNQIKTIIKKRLNE